MRGAGASPCLAPQHLSLPTLARYFNAAAPNNFTDMDYSEFKALFLGADPSKARPGGVASVPRGTGGRKLLQTLPTAWDWRPDITPIKDQGSCGSCWAFSTVGAIEAKYKMVTGLDIDLAEQQLVDCDSANSGCGGGWPTSAMDYIANTSTSGNKGLTVETNYAYTANGNGVSCVSSKIKVVSPLLGCPIPWWPGCCWCCGTLTLLPSLLLLLPPPPLPPPPLLLVLLPNPSFMVLSLPGEHPQGPTYTLAKPGWYTIAAKSKTAMLQAVYQQPTIITWYAANDFDTYAGGG